MPDYPNLLSRVVNTPLLAHAGKAETVLGVLLSRHGMSIDLSIEDAGVNRPKAGPLKEARMVGQYREWVGEPFLYAPDIGLAVIEVTGSLMHRLGRIGAESGAMGYDGIGAQFDAAMDAQGVRAVALDFHTAGGEATGAFNLADRIAARRGEKPIVAVVDEMAFSAGYLLAAAADEIWLASPFAQVGSIGVVTIHLSFEEMLKKEGIKPTIIVKGAHKADGNPYEDLPDGVAAKWDRRSGDLYDAFVSRVATWRGLSEESVRATEADIFVGQEAVDLGLADGIADPMDIVEALAAEAAAHPTAPPTARKAV